DGAIAYDFLVQPPVGIQATGQVVRRTFPELETLALLMSRRHGTRAPVPPATTFFYYTDTAFVGDRAKSMEAYLEALLELEAPVPRTIALRQFLCVDTPPLGPPGSLPGSFNLGDEGCLRVSSSRIRVPLGAVALALSFLQPLQVLGSCSRVCQALRRASFDPLCWPSLRFRSRCVERSLDGLSALLCTASAGLEALALDVAFENPGLGVALPAKLSFGCLRSLELRLGDLDSAALASQLLGATSSPLLRQVHLSGAVLTAELLQALGMAAIAAEGKLVSLKLLWTPD
ncbi:unnamed protein product, partial [Polarella glacialis]